MKPTHHNQAPGHEPETAHLAQLARLFEHAQQAAALRYAVGCEQHSAVGDAVGPLHPPVVGDPELSVVVSRVPSGYDPHRVFAAVQLHFADDASIFIDVRRDMATGAISASYIGADDGSHDVRGWHNSEVTDHAVRTAIIGHAISALDALASLAGSVGPDVREG